MRTFGDKQLCDSRPLSAAELYVGNEWERGPCRCRECAPENFEFDQNAPGYVSVWTHPPEHYSVEVRLEGDFLRRVREAIPGEQGMVAVGTYNKSGQPHLCTNCRGDVCETVLRGHVEVACRERSSE